MINYECKKKESSFISEAINMPMFTSIMLDDTSDLFLMELMFKCPIVCIKFKFSKKFNRLQFGDKGFY